MQINIIGVFLVMLGCLAKGAVAAPPSLLESALSCKLQQGEISKFMTKIAFIEPGMAMPARSFGAPAGSLYALGAPVTVWGFNSNEIYVTPTRIMLVVSGTALKAVAKKLKLAAVPLSPSSRQITATTQVVSYELHQEGLSGKVLVGCQYDDPAAAAWGMQ